MRTMTPLRTRGRRQWGKMRTVVFGQHWAGLLDSMRTIRLIWRSGCAPSLKVLSVAVIEFGQICHLIGGFALPKAFIGLMGLAWEQSLVFSLIDHSLGAQYFD